MKLLGFACLAAFALLACRTFALQEERRLQEAEGLLSLLTYMKTSIKSYGAPLDTLYASFACEALNASGFLSLLRKEGLHRALCRHLPSGISEEAAHRLLFFAEHLGSRFLEDEVIALEDAVSCLSAELSRLAGEAPRRKRMGRALIMTVSMMIFLLFV